MVPYRSTKFSKLSKSEIRFWNKSYIDWIFISFLSKRSVTLRKMIPISDWGRNWGRWFLIEKRYWGEVVKRDGSSGSTLNPMFLPDFPQMHHCRVLQLFTALQVRTLTSCSGGQLGSAFRFAPCIKAALHCTVAARSALWGVATLDFLPSFASPLPNPT